MSGSFMTGQNLADAIDQLLKSNELWGAVAFLGRGAVEKILGLDAKGDPKPAGERIIRLICNLTSGSTNPYAVEVLRDNGVQVKNLANLHAKVLFTRDVSIVSSANISSNGLGEESRSSAYWIEAGIYGPSTPEIEKWFRSMWERKADDIDCVMLKDAKALWNKRKRFNSSSQRKPAGRVPLTPLIVWYEEDATGLSLNEEEIRRQTGMSVKLMERAIEAGLDVVGRDGLDALVPGRWILKWQTDEEGLPILKGNSYQWMKTGQTITQAYRYHKERNWRDIILDASQPGERPPQETDANFRKAFRKLMAEERYLELRGGRGENGPYFEPRLRLMEQFWRQLTAILNKGQPRLE